MMLACHGGFYQVAQWLFEVGAADDIRTKINVGNTPMMLACLNGHLQVAQWLFEVGAAGDIRTTNTGGNTPMMAACDQGYFPMAQWLILAGAVSSATTGQVVACKLISSIAAKHRLTIRRSLSALIKEHAVFSCTIIPGTCHLRAARSTGACNIRYYSTKYSTKHSAKCTNTALHACPTRKRQGEY